MKNKGTKVHKDSTHEA